MENLLRRNIFDFLLFLLILQVFFKKILDINIEAYESLVQSEIFLQKFQKILNPQKSCASI